MDEGLVVVTGANGFIGGALSKLLRSKSRRIRAVTRLHSAGGDHGTVAVGDIGPHTCWGSALEGAECVVHLAGRAHVIDDSSADPLIEYRRVNVLGTERLAREAAAMGIRRLVYISSIGVNGNCSSRPFLAEDIPDPREPYAISKLEAENALEKIAARTGMEVVIIRPPLVYGANAPGNFRRLMEVVARQVPLPFGAIHNKRSLVAVNNLADLIVKCIDVPGAANQILLVSDGEDLSTTELLRRLGRALSMPARLWPVPVPLLTAGATMLGKRALAQRLCWSLQVNIDKTRDLLGWVPPVSVDEALNEAALAFWNTQVSASPKGSTG